MKKAERDFIELARLAINEGHPSEGQFEGTDWNAVFELACKNGLAAVTYDVAKECGGLPEEIRKPWEILRFQVFMRQTSHFKALCEVTADLEAAGIDYAVFKGQAISECYPKPAYRVSSDSDILVSDEDRPRASEVIEKRGYHYEGGKKDKEFTYINDKNGHVIELHTTVFEDYEGVKIDKLKEANLDGTFHRIDFPVNGKTIRTFGVDQHLVYQMYHLIKHFMLEGANVRFFTDITLFVNKNNDKLNPEYLWDWMSKCGFEYFCENYFSICVDYFGMNPAILAGRKARASKEAFDVMLVDCIYGGDVNHIRGKAYQLIYAFMPYLVGEKTSVHSGKKDGFRKAYFPLPSELGDYYAYARKYPVLLPAAWIHRVIRNLILSMTGQKKGTYSAMQKQEIVEDRLSLFSSVGLLDEK